MPTPQKGYRTADGKRVPSVTTVISEMTPKPALVGWAYQRGLDGVPLYESKEQAADIGTITHLMVERFLEGKDVGCPTDDPSLAEPAVRAFEAFRVWAESQQLVVVAQEVQLVSETYRYGGTPDLIAMVRGRRTLLDWKTSGAIYPEYGVQAAAYRLLWNENYPDQELVNECHILRLGKDFGDWTHKWLPDLSVPARQFIRYRKAYEDKKLIDKMMKG